MYSVRLAFASLVSDSPFIKGGMKARIHLHQRIMEYEKGTHRDSAYFINVQNTDIKSLLTGNQMSICAEQVIKKRQVMECIVDIIKVR